MEIRSSGFDAHNCKAVNASQQFTPSSFTDPFVATECFIERAETDVREGGDVKYVDTEVDMSLKEYRYMLEEAQKKGRKEAWDLARRIVTTGENCYSIVEVEKAFGNMNILTTPVEEVLAKDKEYQEEKKALHVGDEVEFMANGDTVKGYVINIVSTAVRVLTKERITGTYTLRPEKCKKTGNVNEDLIKALRAFDS